MIGKIVKILEKKLHFHLNFLLRFDLHHYHHHPLKIRNNALNVDTKPPNDDTTKLNCNNDHKTCSICGINKKKDKFYKKSSNKDNYRSCCIECDKKIKKLKCEKNTKKEIQKNLISSFISDDEVWKDIPINPKYEASSFGRIRIKKTKKIRAYKKPKSGYLRITLYYSTNNQKTFLVHRLIAITFLSNPENKKTVNHIDKNRRNNKVSNLEWNTMYEQNQHKRKYKPPNRKGYSVGISDLSNIDDKEEWKPISMCEKFKEFENYEISNRGRLKYKTKSTYRITTGSLSGGYKKCSLISASTGRRFTTRIHRLVALLFISNPENKPYVNHIDGNGENNNISNLEWATPSENSQHAHDTGLCSTKKCICQLDENNNVIHEFESLKSAYDFFYKLLGDNCSVIPGLSTVLNLYNKQRVSRKWNGYYWCFKNEYEKNKLKIIQYDLDNGFGNTIKEWNSFMEVVEFYLNQTKYKKDSITRNLSLCVRMKQKSYQGFGWKHLIEFPKVQTPVVF